MDADDDLGYAPMARPDMRLVDRVTSLFVADYLTRPADYERFRVCDACAAIMFDGGAGHQEVCLRPAHASGMRFAAAARARGDGEGRRSTLIGLGERAA